MNNKSCVILLNMKKYILLLVLLANISLFAESDLDAFDYGQEWDLLILNLASSIAEKYIDDNYIHDLTVMATENAIKSQDLDLLKYHNNLERVQDDITDQYGDYFVNENVSIEYSFLIASIASSLVKEYMDGVMMTILIQHK